MAEKKIIVPVEESDSLRCASVVIVDAVFKIINFKEINVGLSKQVIITFGHKAFFPNSTMLLPCQLKDFDPPLKKGELWNVQYIPRGEMIQVEKVLYLNRGQNISDQVLKFAPGYIKV